MDNKYVARLDPRDVLPFHGESDADYRHRMENLKSILTALAQNPEGLDKVMRDIKDAPTQDIAETRLKKFAKDTAASIVGSKTNKLPDPEELGKMMAQDWVERALPNNAKEAEGTAPPRSFVLDGAKEIVYGPRQHMYGHASINFQRTAAMWEPIFGTPVNNLQVGLAMILLKVARGGNLVQREATGGPAATFDEIEDTMKDIAGYAEATMRSLFEDSYGNRSHKPK